VTKAVRERKARSLLHGVGLSDFADNYPKTLSHGMRQRCALARTFALDSPIFLMDEPFGALDAQTKLQLEDVLLDLWSSEQCTVVIVMSARLGRIVADVAITLPRSRSARALQRNPVFHNYYAKLWELLEQGISGHDAQ